MLNEEESHEKIWKYIDSKVEAKGLLKYVQELICYDVQEEESCAGVYCEDCPMSNNQAASLAKLLRERYSKDVKPRTRIKLRPGDKARNMKGSRLLREGAFVIVKKYDPNDSTYFVEGNNGITTWVSDHTLERVYAAGDRVQCWGKDKKCRQATVVTVDYARKAPVRVWFDGAGTAGRWCSAKNLEPMHTFKKGDNIVMLPGAKAAGKDLAGCVGTVTRLDKDSVAVTLLHGTGEIELTALPSEMRHVDE